jgi:bacteriorhodopsin
MKVSDIRKAFRKQLFYTIGFMAAFFVMIKLARDGAANIPQDGFFLFTIGVMFSVTCFFYTMQNILVELARKEQDNEAKSSKE